MTYAHTWQIEDHPLVSFLPLNLTDPDSIEYVISHIDFTMQYGEDEEPKEVMYYPLKFRRLCIFAESKYLHWFFSPAIWIMATFWKWNEAGEFARIWAAPARVLKPNVLYTHLSILCFNWI